MLNAELFGSAVPRDDTSEAVFVAWTYPVDAEDFRIEVRCRCASWHLTQATIRGQLGQPRGWTVGLSGTGAVVSIDPSAARQESQVPRRMSPSGRSWRLGTFTGGDGAVNGPQATPADTL